MKSQIKLLRNNQGWLKLASLFALIGLAAGMIGYIIAPELFVRVQEMFAKEFGDLATRHGWGLALGIFRNNLQAAAIMLFAGIVLGIVPILSIGFNFFVIGYLLAAFVASGSFAVFVLAVLPHALVEIPAFIITAAFGLKLGLSWVRKNAEISRKARLKTAFVDALKVLPLIIVLFAIAALIESFVTFGLVEELVR